MTMHRPPWLPHIARIHIADRYIQRRERFEQIFTDFFHKGLLDERLPDITTPSLILWGKQDQIIHGDNAEKWQSLIPGSVLKIWDDIGHMPMLEVPKDSAKIYREFLSQI